MASVYYVPHTKGTLFRTYNISLFNCNVSWTLSVIFGKALFDCFHTTAKCVFWILIRDAHFELKFKIRKKDSVYAKSRRKT